MGELGEFFLGEGDGVGGGGLWETAGERGEEKVATRERSPLQKRGQERLIAQRALAAAGRPRTRHHTHLPSMHPGHPCCRKFQQVSRRVRI